MGWSWSSYFQIVFPRIFNSNLDVQIFFKLFWKVWYFHIFLEIILIFFENVLILGQIWNFGRQIRFLEQFEFCWMSVKSQIFLICGKTFELLKRINDRWSPLHGSNGQGAKGTNAEAKQVPKGRQLELLAGGRSWMVFITNIKMAICGLYVCIYFMSSADNTVLLSQVGGRFRWGDFCTSSPDRRWRPCWGARRRGERPPRADQCSCGACTCAAPAEF